MLQAVAQYIGKQVVVAKPALLIIERDDEQISPFQVLEHPLALLFDKNGIAEWPTQAVEHRSVQQKVLDVFWLVLQNFFDKVLQYIATTARERLNELPQTFCWPPLG